MRPVVWRRPSCAEAFRLRPGASLEVTNANPGLAGAIAGTLSELGYDVRRVEQPSGSADGAVLTEGTTSQPHENRHWSALQAARAARRDSAVIILLQSAGLYSGLEGLSRTLRKEWPGTQTFACTIPGGGAAQVAQSVRQDHADGVIE